MLLCYEHDVRLSVCNVGGLWSHSGTKINICNDRIGRYLGYLHAKADNCVGLLSNEVFIRWLLNLTLEYGRF